MTDWRIWPATNGPSTDAGDAADISRGVIFRLSATGWLKAIRFYRGTTNVGNWSAGSQPPQGMLYTVADGLAVPGTGVTFSLSGTGWQTATLATPVQLNPNVSYKAGVITGNYTATGGYFSTGPGVGGIVQGILTAPDAGGNPSGIGSIQQGSFRQPTVGLQYPNQYFNGGNYWVDVTIADEDPGSDIRDTVGAVGISGLLVSGQPSKTAIQQASVPVGAIVAPASGSKLADIAAALPVSLALSGAPLKVVDDAVTIPIAVTVTATADAVGAGVNAPVSEVLCSSWANYLDVPTRLREKLPTLTEAEWQDNLMLASELLWMLSGRRWYGGGCTETATLRSWPPMQGAGSWPYHRSWGRCGCWAYATWLNGTPYPGDYSGHHVGAPMAVKLPRAPLTNIVSVTINGTPFTEYEMIRNGWIERTDGQPWAVCGGETVITYQYGEPPPAGGKQAAIDLAYELGREQTGDDRCRLPSTTVSVTRQGVTIQRQTADEYQALQRTGLPEVDRWLAAVNPGSRPARARVWSPDIPSAIRTPQ